jgi:hypothetical protein
VDPDLAQKEKVIGLFKRIDQATLIQVGLPSKVDIS